MPGAKKGARKPTAASTNKAEDAANHTPPASRPASPNQATQAESDSEMEPPSSEKGNDPHRGQGAIPKAKPPMGDETALHPLNPPCTVQTASHAANQSSLPTPAEIPDGSSSPPVPSSSTSSGTASTSTGLSPASLPTVRPSTSTAAVNSDPDQDATPPAARPISAPVPATTTTRRVQTSSNYNPEKNYPVICLSALNSAKAFAHPSRLARAMETSPFHGKYFEETLRTTGEGHGVRFEVESLSCLPQTPESVTRLGDCPVRCWVIDPDPANSYTYGRIYPVAANMTDEAMTAAIQVLWGRQSQIIRVSRLPPIRGEDGELTPSLTVRLKFKGPLPDKVSIEKTTFQVRPHTLPVLQCYRCLIYGHGRATCRAPIKCRTCSGPHDSNGCTRAPNCFFCGGEHRPTSRFCPANQEAADIQKQRQEGKLSPAQEKQNLRAIKPGSFQPMKHHTPAAPRAPAVSAPWRADTQLHPLIPSAPPLIEEPPPQPSANNKCSASPSIVPSETTTAITNHKAAASHTDTNPTPPALHPTQTDLSLLVPPHTHTDNSLPVPPHTNTDLSLPAPLHTNTDLSLPAPLHTHTNLSLSAPLHAHKDPSLPTPQQAHTDVSPSAPAASDVPIPETPPRHRTASSRSCPASPPRSPRKKQPPANNSPVQIFPLHQHPFRNPQSLTPPPSTQLPPPPHSSGPVPRSQQSENILPPSSSTQQHLHEQPAPSASLASKNDFSWSSLFSSLIPIIVTFFTNLIAGLSPKECFLNTLPSIQTLFTSVLSSP